MADHAALRDATDGRVTWPNTWSWPVMGIRIDHVLVSEHWRVTESRIGPAMGSDHWPLIFRLRLTDGTADSAALKKY